MSTIKLVVLIPTYNRAEGLRETLEAMCKLDYEGIDVQFIIIENGKKDHTQQVVEGFKEFLSIRYLYEPLPGQYHALNKAMDIVEDGEIIVFTDDDVIPDRNWLKQISETVRKWPQYSIFGGFINPIWPDGKPPAWFRNGPERAGFGLGGHGQDFAEKECVYPPDNAPCGANFWIRKQVLDKGYRFDQINNTHIGKYLSGGETKLFQNLRQDGYEIFYSSYPIVSHRIQRDLLSPAKVHKRAMAMGKGAVYIWGLCQKELLKKSAFLWCGKRFGALVFSIMRYLNPRNFFTGDRGYAARLEAVSDIAYNIESFRVFLFSLNKD